jgi:hypothetical protein
MTRLAVQQEALTKRVETTCKDPEADNGMTAMQAAITALADTMRASQGQSWFRSTRTQATEVKEEAQTLAAMIKAAPSFGGEAEEYY